MKNTTHETVRKSGNEWGWYSYPAIGSEKWNGGYLTKKAATEARREAVAGSATSGAVAEYKFQKA